MFKFINIYIPLPRSKTFPLCENYDTQKKHLQKSKLKLQCCTMSQKGRIITSIYRWSSYTPWVCALNARTITVPVRFVTRAYIKK